MIKFWLPLGDGCEQEIFPPPEAAEELLRVAVHEAGHAEVAKHFGCEVLGIAFANVEAGFRPMAIYTFPQGLTPEDRCTVFAAGSAAEQIHYGTYTAHGASGDQTDIRDLCGEIQYEPLVEKAMVILANRKANLDRVAGILQQRFLHSTYELTMHDLPNGYIGALILHGHEL